MQLPFLSTNTTKGEIYCGILLKEAQGVCYIYEKNPTSVSLLKQREFQYTDGWEHIVDDVDEALSIIEQEMGQKAVASQCVFFVFAHLIDQSTHEIAKPYITKVRDIAKLLELKPVGYIEVIDAVHEELEQEKQARLSSLVVELDDTKMTIFLFKGGHKLVVQHVARSDNFAEDMQGTLEKIAESHILPNYIYLYDSTDLAEESSDLLLHSWKQNLFIQQPRTAVISPTKVSTSLQKLLEKQLCNKPEIAATQTENPSEVLGFTIGKEEEIRPALPTLPKFSLPQFSLPQLSSFKITPLGIVPIFLIALIGAFLFFFHKATVSIHVPQEKKVAEISIQASSSPSKKEQVELMSYTASFSASEKKDTTGKRDVGEKASGEVTLYSYEEKEHSLPNGAKLQQGSLVFETDDTVSIPASQFAADSITKNPGKAKVKVRASTLGTESNIEKNKRFSVADISSSTIFAINESAFAGGTKKTVRTISKTDIDAIKSFVLERAIQDAVKKNASDNTYLVLPELTGAKANSEKYSGEIGEEADVLKYTVRGDVLLARIPKKAITQFVEKKLEDDRPNGFKTESVTFAVKKQEKLETGDIQLTIAGTIVFSKDLDKKKIQESLTGKSLVDVQSLIQTQLSISTYDISINPPLPLIQDWMPFWRDHITVELLR